MAQGGGESKSWRAGCAEGQPASPDVDEGGAASMIQRMTRPRLLRRYRLVLCLFITGLVVSGLTAFPLLWEMRVLCEWLGGGAAPPPAGGEGLRHWVLTVRWGLEEMYATHPWIAYGTDWLAFAHLVLAVFFIGPLFDPVRNVWVLYAGLASCVLILPLALIAGPLRGIPFGWRLIDCSFGVLGAVPLLYCLRLTRKLSNLPDGRK